MYFWSNALKKGEGSDKIYVKKTNKKTHPNKFNTILSKWADLGRRKLLLKTLWNSQHWTHVTAVYTDSVFLVSWLVATLTTDMCRLMMRPKHSWVSPMKLAQLDIVPADLSLCCQGDNLFLNPVCNLHYIHVIVCSLSRHLLTKLAYFICSSLLTEINSSHFLFLQTFKRFVSHWDETRLMCLLGSPQIFLSHLHT